MREGKGKTLIDFEGFGELSSLFTMVSCYAFRKFKDDLKECKDWKVEKLTWDLAKVASAKRTKYTTKDFIFLAKLLKIVS